jgi:hypothetical protein
MRGLRIGLVAGSLALAGLGVTASGVAAYGAADQPLAQIELSGNCNNPSVPFCQEVGPGGIWLWIEVDANGTADVAGAGCGHVPGGGPGTSGAESIRGEFQWSKSDTPEGMDVTFGAYDGSAGYYNVDLGFQVFSFPATYDHWSSHPAPAVAVETQVAP